MTFLNPTSLGLLALSIPLVAIYFLKVRPRLKKTATFFLWDELFEEKKSSALFQKLRDWFSLFLVMLILIFIVLALAEPSFSVENNKDYCIIIDTSASMAATDSGSSRIELAKNKASALISAMSFSRKVSLLSLSDKLSSLSTRTSNRKSLNEKLNKLEASLHIRKQSLLEKFIENKDISKNFRIFLITDKGITPFEGSDNIEIIRVGSEVHNIGLTDFDIRYSMTQKGNIDLFFKLVSTYKKTKEISLTLTYGEKDQILKVIPCTVKPGINKPEFFSCTNSVAGAYTLKAEVEDALKNDNNAYAVLAEIIPIKTKVLGKGSFFFEKCINAFKGYESLMLIVDKEADFTLSNGVVQKATKANLLFNPRGKSYIGDVQDEIDHVGAVSISLKEHALCKIIDWENVKFTGAKKITLPKGALKLVSSESGDALVYLINNTFSKTMVINMDPERTDFFLNPYFPMLIYSSTHEMLNLQTGSPVSYRPGTIPSISHKTEKEILNIAKEITIDDKIIKEKIFPFKQLGFVTVEISDKPETFACSIIGQDESLLNDNNLKSNLKSVHMGLSPSRLLIYLALIILTLECVLYHYRKVG